MLRPSLNQIIKSDESQYKFVVAVAKRAREISEEAEAAHEILEEKPVQLAVKEFASGRCKIAK